MAQNYVKDFNNWNRRQQILDAKSFNDYCHEREIWWCAIGVNIGSEQDGKNEHFERPVLIVKKIRKDLVLIVPLTTKISNETHRIVLNGTGPQSDILLDQSRTVSTKRLLRKCGRIKKIMYQNVLMGLVRILLKDETPLESGESRSPKAKVGTL